MKFIKSKKPGLKVKNTNPTFELEFKNEPLEVSNEVAEKLLENSNFEEVKKSKKVK